MSTVENRIHAYAARFGCTHEEAEAAILADKDAAQAPADPAQARIQELEAVVRDLLSSVVPHVRDTGHNAADREMREAIKAARKAVPVH